MSKDLKKKFGLAITNSALTAVELAGGKSGIRVINHSRVELEPGVIENDCIVVNPEAFKEALSRLMLEAANGPITARNVIISLTEEKTFSHSLEIPKESIENEEFIRELAKDFIPIELDEAATDYKKIKESDDGKTLIINFVAVQNSIVTSLCNILEEAQLNVIGVDISKNSLIRSVNNKYNPNEGDFLVINIDMEETFMGINSASGSTYGHSHKFGGKKIIELIKDSLGSSTNAEALETILNFKNDRTLIDETKQNLIKNKLQEYFQTVSAKIKEISNAIEAREQLKVTSIYLTGEFSSVPGLLELVEAMYPEAEIKLKVEYIEISERTEQFYMCAIGLALAAANGTDANEFNLLTKKKKQELLIAELTPTIKKYLIEISVLFSLIMIFSGVFASKNYLNYKISEQKATILSEKALNPYLTEVAKTEQEKLQLENQIYSITKNAIPASRVINQLDNYNKGGIDLVNINFINNEKTEKLEIFMRAKASSRTETELLVIELETDSSYKEIISPLSNLVGKGERFINISIELDPQEIIEAYENQKILETQEIISEDKNESESRPKPAIQPADDLPDEEGEDTNDSTGDIPIDDTDPTDEATSDTTEKAKEI